MSIAFNVTAAVAEFRSRLIQTMQKLQMEFLADAQNHMVTWEGESDVEPGALEDVAGVIAASIVGGIYAAMDEWGKGSLMDRTNPALDEYRRSESFNPLRGDDLAIRGRPKGEYTDIFGERQKSSGEFAGVNLEKVDEKFAPRAPSHAIRTAARWMENHRLKAELQRVISGFPWGRFIEVGRE